MVYVALLRGINVGGKNKIDMKLLKETFVRTGMESVTTYINSGNVIFTDMKHTKTEITNLLEEAIFRYFQLNIKVLIRSLNDFEHMIKVLPESWRNDKNMRSDVLFLWEEFDRKTVINELKIKPEVDTVMYVPGAILWTLDKVNITKSGLNKFIGTDVYKKMTARNFNTTSKIYEIMKGLE
ncbi:MAG: DUF1697 domain-containing protein [Clostridium sp.]|uniref:DUF1697 domain-containing protein n=1 Tax=Clostridium sp. TaxID=1506 RepID=UPI0029001EE6|nr:DUF1697 domain-containing protein [Clostridium sp.]MDU2461591.1 DUF1697 domain-containing protein [Clostridium sp.]